MSYDSEPRVGGSSPWGQIDYAGRVWRRDDGVIAVSVSTASHGGIWVRPDLRGGIPTTPYSRSGAFWEEDCDWAFPYLALGLGRGDVPENDHTDAAVKTLTHAYDGQYAEWARKHAGVRDEARDKLMNKVRA